MMKFVKIALISAVAASAATDLVEAKNQRFLEQHSEPRQLSVTDWFSNFADNVEGAWDSFTEQAAATIGTMWTTSVEQLKEHAVDMDHLTLKFENGKPVSLDLKWEEDNEGLLAAGIKWEQIDNTATVDDTEDEVTALKEIFIDFDHSTESGTRV